MKRPFQIRLSKHLNCIWAGRGGDWSLEEGGWAQGYTVAKCKTRTLSPGCPTSRKVCFSSESQLWLLSQAATGMWELFCLEAGYSYSWNQILQSVSQLRGKASLKFFFFSLGVLVTMEMAKNLMAKMNLFPKLTSHTHMTKSPKGSKEYEKASTICSCWVFV